MVLVKESMVKEGFSVFETAVGSPGDYKLHPWIILITNLQVSL